MISIAEVAESSDRSSGVPRKEVLETAIQRTTEPTAGAGERPSVSKDERERLVIEPGGADCRYWADVWRFRELFFILAWRDLSVRYRQTVIGIAWAVLQPLLTMLVMTVVFGVVARLPSDGNAPYALLVFAGMLPWQFFASAVSLASQSMLANSNLISKVYFPRLIVPASAVITSFVDLLVGFAILLGMMAWYQYSPSWRMLCLPLFMMMAFLAALGPGLLLAGLNVKYRDFRYVIPFFVQFGLYVSPVGYSSSVIRERFGETAFALYACNPMVGVIDGFRWSIVGQPASIHWGGLGISIAVVALLMVTGVWNFRQTERTFADVV